MKTTTLLLLTTALALLCSCEKLGICRDRDLQVDRQNYTGNRMRTDGYYYGISDTDENGLVLNEVLLFYKNGVVAFPGDVSEGNEELYIHLMSGYSGLRDSKSAWGTFKVEDSLLYICKWKPAPCGYPAVMRTCEIINDTTFIVREMDIKGKYGTGTVNKDQKFRFRALYPKPDSLNNFVKE